MLYFISNSIAFLIAVLLNIYRYFTWKICIENRILFSII